MKNNFSSIVPGFNKLLKNSSESSEKRGRIEKDDGLGALVKNMSGLPVHVVDGVKDVITNVTDYLVIAEQEETKRTEITAKRDVALASIRSQREAFSELMQYTFQERAAVLQKQFEALDLAMASGNAEIANSSLNAMVSIIQTSPFKNIQDMQQALGNKDFVVRLE